VTICEAILSHLRCFVLCCNDPSRFKSTALQGKFHSGVLIKLIPQPRGQRLDPGRAAARRGHPGGCCRLPAPGPSPLAAALGVEPCPPTPPPCSLSPPRSPIRWVLRRARKCGHFCGHFEIAMVLPGLTGLIGNQSCRSQWAGWACFACVLRVSGPSPPSVKGIFDLRMVQLSHQMRRAAHGCPQARVLTPHQ